MADKKITMIYGFLTSLASKVTCMFRGQSTDVQSALDSIGAYSTSEEIVGTWIDGKPIYRTVIEGITPSGGSHKFETPNLNIEQMIKFDVISTTQAWVYKYPFVNIVDPDPTRQFSSGVYYVFTDNSLTFTQSELYDNLPFIAIFEYTKTTD